MPDPDPHPLQTMRRKGKIKGGESKPGDTPLSAVGDKLMDTDAGKKVKSVGKFAKRVLGF